MKRLLFIAIMLMSMLVCGTALAADITGTYICQDVSGKMIIKKSGTGYSAKINTSDPDHPNKGTFWCGFEGKGTFNNNTLTVKQSEGGNTLQIAIKINNNVATIDFDDVEGEGYYSSFCGASGGPGFEFTYKKK